MEQSVYRAEVLNSILLRGELVELPVFSHENHGKRFDKFMLSVQRLSGTRDLIRVVAEESLLEKLDPTAGELVEVEGQVRSYNNRSGEGRKLLISVYAVRIEAVDDIPENDVFLQGRICREPVYRRTPLGREICDVMLSVERKYGRRDILPCILWGSLARMAADCVMDTEIWIRGRLQSRTYVKQLDSGSEERTAYEISAITAGFPED